MKKTLLFFITLFSISNVFAQADCLTAQEVMLNSTNVAPAYATETGVPPTNFCGLNNNNNLPTKGKWYKFTALQNIDVTISTVLAVNNNSDTRLLVYTGDCSNLTCLVANDDYSGGLTSQVTFPATANVTYIVAFDNRYSQNGFTFTVNEAAPPAADRLSFTSTPVSGIAGNYNNCIADMNGDYLDDIVSPISTTSLSISYQQTNGSFVTTNFPLTNTVASPSWSIAVGDYDNNGYNDLLYGSGSGVCFLKANSTGSAFTTDRKTQSYLVQRTNFVDINNDGFLDGFACDDNAPNRYYMNDGTNLNPTQGGIGDFATGGNYASNWADFDNDGHIDMYLAKCGQGGSGVGGNIDQIFKNDGFGSYTNVAAAASMANAEQTWSGAVGDFNNDGWMDVVVGVNSTSSGNTKIKKNNGDFTFSDVTPGSGYDTATATGREYVAADFDNDGFLDVLGSGGNIMFGDGAFHFTPNPNNYPISTVDRPFGDLNNDGFLDIQNGNNILYNNGNANHWSVINLQGVSSNRNGIGARVEIYGAWGKQIRDVQSGTGFQNMSTINTHFGLGAATSIDQIIIKWPSGTVDTVLNPNIDSPILIVEDSTNLASQSFASSIFSISPNPTSDLLNINLKDNSNIVSIRIIDMNGKVVMKSEVTNSISVKSLANGTYFVNLQNKEGKSFTQKFIKQ